MHIHLLLCLWCFVVAAGRGEVLGGFFGILLALCLVPVLLLWLDERLYVLLRVFRVPLLRTFRIQMSLTLP